MTYDTDRVTRLLVAMTHETCQRFPDADLPTIWEHVDGAIRILNDTTALDYDARMAIVKDAYDVSHERD